MWCNFQKDITCSVSVCFCEHFFGKFSKIIIWQQIFAFIIFFWKKWITTRGMLLLRTEKNFEAVRHITFVGQYVTAQISCKISCSILSGTLTRKQRNSVWDTKQFYMYIMHPNLLHLFSVVETWHSKKLRY